MNYPPFAMIFKDQFWRGLVIHQANRVISRYAELVEEILETSRKAPGDILRRNVVAAVRYEL